ncbi:MAG TPA: hypothetical protein VH120_18100, partial [Gemmataceae bacterium]|nr:hypothetical protein [Gemmataceae bacterium]
SDGTNRTERGRWDKISYACDVTSGEEVSDGRKGMKVGRLNKNSAYSFTFKTTVFVSACHGGLGGLDCLPFQHLVPDKRAAPISTPSRRWFATMSQIIVFHPLTSYLPADSG